MAFIPDLFRFSGSVDPRPDASIEVMRLKNRITNAPRYIRFLALALTLTAYSFSAAYCREKLLRVGYFPNITHAHALVAQNMAVEGNGWFENRLPGVRLEWLSFNAGPSAMEALFAGAVDLTYVGPNPVLNAYIRSRGEVKVISGAVRGGAGLVVRKDSGLTRPADFIGKRIATPQLGNTQDIACRYWLIQSGLKVTMGGGDVAVIPTQNSGMAALFALGEIDAAWTVEPWLSRLELDGGASLAYAEPAETSITTVLACGRQFAEEEADLVADFVKAHGELTEWIQRNPGEAKKRVTDELTRQTRSAFPHKLTEHAWPRLVFADAITPAEFALSLEAARSVGFLKGDFDLANLVAPAR